MIYFDSDYMAGAHPKVMTRLAETNLEQTVGYGCDIYTSKAAHLIDLNIDSTSLLRACSSAIRS